MRKMMSTLHKAGGRRRTVHQGRAGRGAAPLHALRQGRTRAAHDREMCAPRFSRQTRRWQTARCACWQPPCAPTTACPPRLEPETLENELCFVGLVGMIDPVRPEVRAAIEECHRAGIRPIMITGDHIDTADGDREGAGHSRGRQARNHRRGAVGDERRGI